jgi:protoporphyrinogen oxidase
VNPVPVKKEEELAASCRDGLIRCGILRTEDRIVTRRTFRISPAYVIYDRYRMGRLDPALRELARMGIRSAGRYGAWYYNSMEDSLAEGRETARILRERP